MSEVGVSTGLISTVALYRGAKFKSRPRKLRSFLKAALGGKNRVLGHGCRYSSGKEIVERLACLNSGELGLGVGV